MEMQHLEVKKDIVNGGMKNREGYINEKDLKRAIKLLKENKATDESGMIAEYIKAMGDQDFFKSQEVAE